MGLDTDMTRQCYYWPLLVVVKPIVSVSGRGLIIKRTPLMKSSKKLWYFLLKSKLELSRTAHILAKHVQMSLLIET